MKVKLPSFSLRSLIISVFIAAVITAWASAYLRKARTEQNLRATLLELGATISLTNEDRGWISGIHFSDATSLNDKHLEELAKLKHLQVLWLTESQVTGDGLKTLLQFPALRELHVGENQLTGNGALYLKQLDRLKKLTFWVPFDDPRPKEILQALPNVQNK